MSALFAPTVRELASIIIPCRLITHEQARLLHETLQSVSAQTYPDYEVILVDDGSTVPVPSVAGAYPQTNTLRQDQAGPAIARNTASHIVGDSTSCSWTQMTISFLLRSRLGSVRCKGILRLNSRWVRTKK